ncbi:MAG: hypothetical protein LC107_06845 [Chitinophagales bacterium]|nr:hypothetical protein [Chitinophagales bacterium]
MAKLNSVKTGILSFMIVLLLMPIGHTLMILNEKILHDYKFLGAFIIGLLGLALLVVGVMRNEKSTLATILGLLGGILVWTGWIEFSFVWIAEKLKVAPLMEDGEIVTKPEYLVMMSSLGLLLTFIVLFLFTRTKCTFFNWFQRVFKLKNHLKLHDNSFKPLAVITFIEVVMIMWTFYILLLVVYDNDIAGDRHPATYIVAYGSLVWSLYLIAKLLKINKFDSSIRYAIPTVIIFWNFVEILGRWDYFKEVWVHPMEHKVENILISAALVAFVIFYFYGNKIKEEADTTRRENFKMNRKIRLSQKPIRSKITGE